MVCAPVHCTCTWVELRLLLYHLLQFDDMADIPQTTESDSTEDVPEWFDYDPTEPLPETARVLLDHGADLAALDTDGRTALEVAKNTKNEAVAQYLAKCLSIRSSL